MKNFKQLLIWQKGFGIAIESFKLIETFPKEERFNLASQITRAAISIPSNISEGSSRSSEKDYARFIQISLGSCYELETQLLISEALKFGENKLCSKLLTDVCDEQKMLISFMNKLHK